MTVSTKPLSVVLTLTLLLSLVITVLPALPAAAATYTIGVLRSASSSAFSAGNPPHSYAGPTNVTGRENRAMQWVEDNGHTLVILSDADLANPNALAGIDALILSRTWAMNENASLTVRNWVKQGGALLPILASPRVFLAGGVWKLWVQELNYEAWEWGPLSEAYQMMFDNDPSIPSFETTLRPGHAIVSDALAALSLSSAKLTWPQSANSSTGVEFVHPYNSNVRSILDYQSLPTAQNPYEGTSAAWAARYGAGRVVYFGFPLIDFLPPFRPVLAAMPVGGGHNQGDLVDALLDAAVEWAVDGGGYGAISPAAVTSGEIDSWGTAIYVRARVQATGIAPLSGHMSIRFYNPAGTLVREHRINDLGIEPGANHMFSRNYQKGSLLDAGRYRVVLEYTYTYPHYSFKTTAQAFVTRSQGAGIKTTPVTTTNQPAVMVGDFDNSGESDLAMFGLSDSSWWVLKSSGSAFAPDHWETLGTASGWLSRMSGDYNGDGRADIAQYHPSNGTWWVSRSTGTAFATAKWADFSTASGWVNRMVGDYNGDGRDDIAQFHPANGTWWVSRSTGGAFSTTTWADFSTASGWQAPLVGDFNGDGRDDIAQYHPSNGSWWVSRSTGTGFTTSMWADFSTASGWVNRMVGDFNGDGRDDIAQFHPSNGTWWVSRSTGTAFTTSIWADFSTVSGWQAHLTGDFNNDGRDDLAQFHPSNGTWWISRSTGTGFATSQWADFTTPSGWTQRHVGDFNGDNRDDIVQTHGSNGTWWVSRSTGTGFVTENWAAFSAN